MKKIIDLIILIGILFLVPGVFAQYCPGYGGMMSGGYGTSFMIFSWILTILVVLLIIAAIYWLIKSANRR